MLERLRDAWNVLAGKASATGPLVSAWVQGQPVWTPRRYDQLADEAFTRNIVAFACVDLIARSVGSLRLMPFKGERELPEDNPLARLIRRPNPMQGTSRWLHSTVAWHCLTGNSYIEAVPTIAPGRGSSPVGELWCLRADRMKIIPGPNGMPEAYRYSVPAGDKDFPVNIVNGRSMVLHLKDFHPLDDWYGLSPVEVAARWIDLDNAATTMNYHLMKNGANPSGIFSYKGSMQPAQFESAEKNIRDKWSGVINAGRPILLPGEWSFQRVTETLRDMEWTEGMREAGRRICAAWGVPHVLIIPGESTYNNRESGRLELWEHTVLPLADLMLGDIVPWLQWLFDDERLAVKYDRDSIPALEARRIAKREGIIELHKEKIITKNEAREALDYDAVEGGDEFPDPMAQMIPPGQQPGTPRIPPKQPAPKPGKADGPALYAALRVLPSSAAALEAWAREQGIANVVPAAEMHCTTVHSRTPVPAYKPANQPWDREEIDPTTYWLARLNGALVLVFASAWVETRHAWALQCGATWDFEGYKPHVTLSYDPGPVQIISPPRFAIELGEEWTDPPMEADGLTGPFDSPKSWRTQVRAPAGSPIGGQWIGGGGAAGGFIPLSGVRGLSRVERFADAGVAVPPPPAPTAIAKPKRPARPKPAKPAADISAVPPPKPGQVALASEVEAHYGLSANRAGGKAKVIDDLGGEEVRESLSFYVGNLYSDMNSSLRGGPVREDRRELVEKHTPNMDRMFQSSLAKPLPANAAVYRGGPAMKPGEYVDKGFTSTSLDRKIAYSFTEDSKDGVLYRITNRSQTTKAVYYDGIKTVERGVRVQEEQEVIINRGARYRVHPYAGAKTVIADGVVAKVIDVDLL